MCTRILRQHLTRPLTAPRFAARVLATLALLAPACGSDIDADAPALKPQAANFALLANAAVTCTDGYVTGDVGTFLAVPTGAVTLTRSPVTGTARVGDAIAKQGFDSFLTTYAALAPKQGGQLHGLDGYSGRRDACARRLLFRGGSDVDRRVDAQRTSERKVDFQDRYQWHRSTHGHQLLNGHVRRRAGVQCDLVGRASGNHDNLGL